MGDTTLEQVGAGSDKLSQKNVVNSKVFLHIVEKIPIEAWVG